MREILAGVLAVHGLIHVMGFAKAFGYADLPQLTKPISRTRGLLWIAAAALVVATAVMLLTAPHLYWKVGMLALVLSQAVIATSWRDARAGSAANLILLLVVAHGWLTEGPRSLRAQFDRDAATSLARPVGAALVTAADLALLPEPVERYLRLTGALGQPRIQSYRLRFRGRIRSAPGAPWMSFEAVQQSFADEPTRLFLLRARMFALPVESFHRFVAGRATMQVKVLGVMPMAFADGAAMDRSETVTLFNDMCVLAPGTLVGPGLRWELVDSRSVRARFSIRGLTIAATLYFGEDGLLTNFVSDDRSRVSADGKVATRLRFSTPVRDYRAFGPLRLASHGEVLWHLPDGEFTYGEFDLQDASFNGRP